MAGKSNGKELQKLHDLIPKTDKAGQTSDACELAKPLSAEQKLTAEQTHPP